MRGSQADDRSALIMMVDDEPTTLDVMEMFLREEGYTRFVKTTEPSRVLELLHRERPTLLLLNLVMPGLDGFEVLEQMRSDASLRGIPVVLVTSSTERETKRRAIAQGAVDFLSKPVDRSELTLRVRNTLAAVAFREANQRGRPEGARSGAEQRPSQGPPLVSRLDVGDVRCRTIIRSFAERLEDKLEAMEACLESGDLEGLSALGHWLKGAAGTVGFDAFTQPAETLRLLAQEGKRHEIDDALGAIRDMADRMVVPGRVKRAEHGN